MTSERIAEIKALCDAAMSGPWKCYTRQWYGEPLHIIGNDDKDCIGFSSKLNQTTNFIAAARQIIPELLEEIDSLHKSIEAMAHDLHKWEVCAEEKDLRINEQKRIINESMKIMQLANRTVNERDNLRNKCAMQEARAEEAEQQVKQYQEGFLKKQEESFYSDMEVARLTTLVEVLMRAIQEDSGDLKCYVCKEFIPEDDMCLVFEKSGCKFNFDEARLLVKAIEIAEKIKIKEQEQ